MNEDNQMMGGCGSAEPFALQVRDNSMEPEFKNGCIIVIDPAGLIENGSYVLALIENGYIFRQLWIEQDTYYIQPVNDEYMHEKRAVAKDAIKGVIVQQAGATGRRKDRKNYL